MTSGWDGEAFDRWLTTEPDDEDTTYTDFIHCQHFHGGDEVLMCCTPDSCDCNDEYWD